MGYALHCSLYFNPRPPRGGRRRFHCPNRQQKYFNPRPPRGGRLFAFVIPSVTVVISIHVLREEDDRQKFALLILPFYFNPRPPRGGRRSSAPPAQSTPRFQSTSSARRTTAFLAPITVRAEISIHVLREEDDNGFCKSCKSRVISIHVLREEDDCVVLDVLGVVGVFQSTSSARRTTKSIIPQILGTIFQSTSSARRTTGHNRTRQK